MMIAQIVQKLFGPVFQGTGANGPVATDEKGGEQFAELVQGTGEIDAGAAIIGAAPPESMSVPTPPVHLMFLDGRTGVNQLAFAAEPASNDPTFGQVTGELAGQTYSDSNTEIDASGTAGLSAAPTFAQISAQDSGKVGPILAGPLPAKGDSQEGFQLSSAARNVGAPDDTAFVPDGAPVFDAREIGQREGFASDFVHPVATKTASLMPGSAVEFVQKVALQAQFETAEPTKTLAKTAIKADGTAGADAAPVLAGNLTKLDENTMQVSAGLQGVQAAVDDLPGGKPRSFGQHISGQSLAVPAQVLGANGPSLGNAAPQMAVAAVLGPNPARSGKSAQMNDITDPMAATFAQRTPLDSAAQVAGLANSDAGQAPPAAVAVQNRVAAWQAFERYMFEQRGDVHSDSDSFADLGASFGGDLRSAGPVSAALGGFASAPASPAGPALSAQIVSHAAAAQSGPVEITLNPIELGQLRFEIQQNGEAVQIILSAERGDTLDLLRRNSDQLLADFRAAGFGGASLSFGGWGAGQNQGFAAPSEEAAPDAPLSAQVVQPAAFVAPRPALDQSRSLNIRL